MPQSVRRRKARFLAPAMVLALACVPMTPPALALQRGPSQATPYDIPAQDLATALIAFGVQTRLQLAYSNELVAGLKTETLSGVYSPERALTRLLKGTGLTWRRLNNRAILVERDIATKPPDVFTTQPPSPAPAPSRRRIQLGENRASETISIEELIVTGSRIIRDGFQAPTPLAVLDVTVLNFSSTSNIADYVNTMSVFAGSSTPSTTSVNVSQGTSGVNALNLRGLGTGRTLVLLDGQRSVGAFLTGAVDINTFPQQLVQRVEVVTGGASAVYGSDAVGGVANFVLDKSYTGTAGEISGGVTSFGDNKNYKVAVSTGFPFAGGRGHVLLSGEHNDKEGIVNGSGGVGKRPWMGAGWTIMRTPGYSATTGANGAPEFIVRDRVDLSVATHGGIIVSGPLKGLAFGAGGQAYQFDYGPLNDGRNMQGGEWKATATREERGNSLDPSESRQNAFTRISYDVTDRTNLFVQASWAHSGTLTTCCSQFSVGNITIRGDNAFLLKQLSPQQAALITPATTMMLGTMHYDLPPDLGRNDRIITRYVVGGSGKIAAFSSEWSWDAYYQRGHSRNSLNAPNIFSRSKLAQAVDAVRHPTTGLIVCRSTLTNPGDGCVPYSVFGTGVNSTAAIDFITGLSHLNQTLVQNVWAASATGEPLSNWAGPVSLAVSAEHRKESVRGVSDPASQISDWLSGNYRPTFGSFTVTEGALETVAPLANDLSWVDTWDLQAAARFTGYSTSGFVVTWKLGTTYAPAPGIKLRLTRSRDIRAPNLQELYAGGTAGSSGVFDPFTNTTPVPLGLITGNTALKPEKADTTGIGVVTQPGFLPGLSASVDYWDIKIKDAIGSLSRQQQIDACYAGGPKSQRSCDGITRNAQGMIVQVATQPFNLAVNRARGLDFAATYRRPMSDLVGGWSGTISVHGTATNYIKNYTNNGVDEPTDTAGENSGNAPPDWRYTATLIYENSFLRSSLTARGVSAGVYSNSYIACTSNCPLSTGAHRTIDMNSIAGALYWDASLTHKFGVGEKSAAEVFINVRNLANKTPPVVAPLGTGSAYWSPLSNPALYDLLGRVFRAGLRIRI